MRLGKRSSAMFAVRSGWAGGETTRKISSKQRIKSRNRSVAVAIVVECWPHVRRL